MLVRCLGGEGLRLGGEGLDVVGWEWEETRFGSGEAFDGEKELVLLCIQTRISHQAGQGGLRSSSASRTQLSVAQVLELLHDLGLVRLRLVTQKRIKPFRVLFSIG